MTNKTKLKIIQWITKLLKYYPPIQVPYRTDEYKINTVEYRGLIYEYEATIDEGHRNHVVATNIGHELIKQGAINISVKEDEHRKGEYNLEAKMYYIIK